MRRLLEKGLESSLPAQLVGDMSGLFRQLDDGRKRDLLPLIDCLRPQASGGQIPARTFPTSTRVDSGVGKAGGS
jgi:hypothetical protein